MIGNMCLPAHMRLLRQLDDLRCVDTCSDTFVIIQHPDSPPVVLKGRYLQFLGELGIIWRDQEFEQDQYAKTDGHDEVWPC